METNELYLKTAFCCMACDGEIANEEMKLIKEIAENSNLFENLDIEILVNSYMNDLKELGNAFVSNYLFSINSLTKEQELKICHVAIMTILADKKIEYNEIAFFKKIRTKLSVSDEEIMSDSNIQSEFSNADKKVLQGQNLQSFLLPDIIDESIFDWNNVSYEGLKM